MTFCFELRSDHTPPLVLSLVLAISGRLLDPPGFAVSINGVFRRAQWSGTKLTFDECVLLRFGLHSSSLLYELDVAQLPASVVEVLNTLLDAGAEATLANCDLCNALVPAVVIEAHTVCACPDCRRNKNLSPPATLAEDSPF